MIFDTLYWLRYLVVLFCGMQTLALAEEKSLWEIPLGGNAFLTSKIANSADGVQNSGIVRWQDEKSIFSIYFRPDRMAELELSLRLKVPQGESQIRASVGGKTIDLTLNGPEFHDVSLGKIPASAAGYIHVDLQGIRKSTAVFAEVSHLIVSSATSNLQIAHVSDNKGNMFYWGHRGPSVHLGYQMPRGKKICYAYNELTVPKGEDPIGSYFMANGFGEGYFGIQVKSETERWILFSVWSPFSTDDPKSIPEDHRVKLLAKGNDVRDGSFGGEGSGGQSFMIYPWKAGVTYKFLNSVKPDGQGNTIYSAWFGEVGKAEWQLIATFQRPKTDKYLTGFHSFLECFSDRLGYLERRVIFTNQWVCDDAGQWYELTGAHFTVDGTGGNGHRLDFSGGLSGKGFFLRNGGFFNDNVKQNQSFTRPAMPTEKPAIDVSQLPNK